MKLHLMQLVDDDQSLPAALQELLLGPHLAELVTELVAVRGPGDLNRTLADVLGEDTLQAMLTSGMQAADVAQLHELLRHPHLLPQLRDRILAEGSEYWDHHLARRYEPSAEIDARLRRQQSRLEEWIAEQDRPRPSSLPGAATGSGVSSRTWWRSPWLVAALSSAAALLVGIGLGRYVSGPAAAPSAAWTSPELLTAAPPEVYFRRLSAAAEAMVPAAEAAPTAEDVARQLAIFKHGCTLISLHKHPSLSGRGQQYLQESCAEAIREVDAAWFDLLHGTSPVEVQQRLARTAHSLARSLASPPADALEPPGDSAPGGDA